MKATSSSGKPMLRIGTRGSVLALTQARWIEDRLRCLYPDLTIVLEIIKTQGDSIPYTHLRNIAGKGVFTREIENALLDGHVDIAVHSMKDLPITLPSGLVLAAVPQREDARDALVTKPHGIHGFDPQNPIASLPPHAAIGTSSPRRKAQLLHHGPDLNITDIRGNLDTRLRKLHNGEFDAILVAVAGLKRIDCSGDQFYPLSFEICLPAAGQGALAVECREEDTVARDLLQALDHPATKQAVCAERSLLKHLGGGCQVPIAAYAEMEEDRLCLHALVATPDGATVLRDSLTAETNTSPEEQGRLLARRLLDKGAKSILTRAALQE